MPGIQISGMNEGIIDESNNHPFGTPSIYESQEIDRIYRSLVGEKAKKKVAVIIDDDHLEKIKEDRITMTSDEIKLASVTEPISVILKKLRTGMGNHKYLCGLGSLYYTRHDNRGKGTDSLKKSILIGYVTKDELITDNIKASLIYDTSILRTLKYLIYCMSDKKIKIIERSVFENYYGGLNNTEATTWLSTLSYKIKDSDLSGKVFGLAKYKAGLVGKIIDGISIERGTSKVLNREIVYAVITYEGRTTKFCLQDLELVLPDLKGYNFPKNTTIEKNSKIIIKSDKDGSQYKVIDIYNNDTSKRINKNGTTRQLDVLQIVNLDNNSVTKIYAKHAKLVTN